MKLYRKKAACLPETVNWLTLRSSIVSILLMAPFVMISLHVQGLFGLFWCFPALIFVSVITAQKERLKAVNTGLRAEIADRKAAEERLAYEAARHRETSRDLEWALHEAREANQAKSRFLSGMTHELRTPLNSILGFSQMLDGLGGPLTEKQKTEYVGYIRSSGDRLYDLINQVLDLAGIEAGKLSFTLDEVRPAPVVARVVDELRLLADERGITLTNDTHPAALPSVSTDPARMTQALVNLVGNAIKYNRRGGDVRIFATSGDAMLRLSVADTGHGIPAAHQKNVFEAFNRLGAETSGIEGSGVGLSLTKEFIEGMGGKIGFESVAGQGTTFWFELPLARQATAKAS